MTQYPKRTKFLLFSLAGESATGLTVRVEVHAVTGALLGRVQWFGRWRRYGFFPEPDTVLDAECLADIAEHCRQMMADRRAG